MFRPGPGWPEALPQQRQSLRAFGDARQAAPIGRAAITVLHGRTYLSSATPERVLRRRVLVERVQELVDFGGQSDRDLLEPPSEKV